MSGTEKDIRGLVRAIGRKQLADACEIKRASVAQWVYNNIIPDRHIPNVVKLARDGGIDLERFGFRAEGT